MSKKDLNEYPPGLDAKKVKEIIAYHEDPKNEAHIIARDEAAFGEGATYVSVPKSLMPKVEALIAQHETK